MNAEKLTKYSREYRRLVFMRREVSNLINALDIKYIKNIAKVREGLMQILENDTLEEAIVSGIVIGVSSKGGCQ